MAVGPKRMDGSSGKKADEIFAKFNDSKLERLNETKKAEEKFIQISLRVEEQALETITYLGRMMGIGKSGAIRYAINKLNKEFEKSDYNFIT